MHATVLAIHIGAGAVALVVGFVALYAAKGAGLHRRSGTVFVYAMVAMAMLGAAIAGVWGPAAATNVPVGLLSTYLVITALTTVVPERRGSRAGSIGLMLGASTVGLFMFSSALQALARGGKSSAFAVPLLVFTAVGLLGAAGDSARAAPRRTHGRRAPSPPRVADVHRAADRRPVVQHPAAENPAGAAPQPGRVFAPDARRAGDDDLLAMARPRRARRAPNQAPRRARPSRDRDRVTKASIALIAATIQAPALAAAIVGLARIAAGPLVRPA